jgi:hypothetical protein
MRAKQSRDNPGHPANTIRSHVDHKAPAALERLFRFLERAYACF